MKESDVVYRCNLVTLTEEDVPYEEQRILDHSSGEISTEAVSYTHLDVYKRQPGNWVRDPGKQGYLRQKAQCHYRI